MNRIYFLLGQLKTIEYILRANNLKDKEIDLGFFKGSLFDYFLWLYRRFGLYLSKYDFDDDEFENHFIDLRFDIEEFLSVLSVDVNFDFVNSVRKDYYEHFERIGRPDEVKKRLNDYDGIIDI